MLLCCEECGNQVSSKARCCPKCGCPVDPHASSVPPGQRPAATPSPPIPSPAAAAAPTAPTTPTAPVPATPAPSNADAPFPWQVTTPTHIRLEIICEASLLRQLSSLDPASTVVDANGVRHPRLGDIEAFSRGCPKETLLDPSAPRGVGGWLAFLVAGLIILWPLFSLGMTAADMASIRSANPAFLDSPVGREWATCTWGMVLVACVCQIAIGVLLIRSTRRQAVTLAIWCLWLSGPGSLIASWVITAAILGGEVAGKIAGEMLVGGVKPVLWACVWTAYLLVSKRVHRTYVD